MYTIFIVLALQRCKLCLELAGPLLVFLVVHGHAVVHDGVRHLLDARALHRVENDGILNALIKFGILD